MKKNTREEEDMPRGNPAPSPNIGTPIKPHERQREMIPPQESCMRARHTALNRSQYMSVSEYPCRKRGWASVEWD